MSNWYKLTFSLPTKLAPFIKCYLFTIILGELIVFWCGHYFCSDQAIEILCHSYQDANNLRAHIFFSYFLLPSHLSSRPCSRRKEENIFDSPNTCVARASQTNFWIQILGLDLWCGHLMCGGWDWVWVILLSAITITSVCCVSSGSSQIKRNLAQSI